MNCNRNKCPNILCDTYVPSVGYICKECQGEFIEYMKSIDSMDIDNQLKVSIDTPKGSQNSNIEFYIKQYFEEYTRD